jgi:hypothetical protein
MIFERQSGVGHARLGNGALDSACAVNRKHAVERSQVGDQQQLPFRTGIRG